jgi:putative colanic acid biosysnthesis UDP-glucose lipid carrier transferase
VEPMPAPTIAIEPEPTVSERNAAPVPASRAGNSKPIPVRRAYSSAGVRFLQFVTDVIALNVTYHVMLLARFGAFFWENPARLRGAPWSIYPELEIFMNLFWVAISVSLQVYRPWLTDHPTREQELTLSHRASGSLDQIRIVGRAGIFLAASLLLFIVAQGGYNYYSRLFLAFFLTSIPVVLAGIRIVEQSARATVRLQKSPRKNIIVIGAGYTGERFYQTVVTNPNYGYRVLGFLDDNGVESGVRSMILGKLRDLDRVASRETVDEVIIALPHADEQTIARLVTECENRCIRVALLPGDDVAYSALASRTIERVGDLSLVRMREAPLDRWMSRMLKRAFDIVFSIAALMVVFPIVFLASALFIKLSSRGPIFFQQARTGEDGQTFICYKFRTMREDRSAHLIQATKDDPRLTTVGRILRRTSMDELPQFWNVLKGEMSVVGPRPHMLKNTEDYRKIIAQYMVRHFVKPGLTGWAQVNGFRGSTRNPNAMQRRIEHDLYYIENWSFLFDLTIVARTIVSVLRGDKNAY